MKELTLSEIWIYPIKALGGIQLNTGKVMEKGLAHDRRWMLIDGDNECMTQRTYPTLALFQLFIDQAGIINVTKKNPHQDQTSISFDPSGPTLGEGISAKIFDDHVIVHEVNPQISQWFASHIGVNCKLVSFPETNPRSVDPDYKVNDEHVSLADAYPFLIIGQQSLDELNSRLQKPLPMNRFRPNFVFTGGEAFEEDHWRNITIGKNRFIAVKPCARCVVPTVDQATGIKGVEPTLTLSTFRKRNNKVYFGENLVALDHTAVSVGDKIILN